ncbi:hypothetical protein D3C80_1730960 [compost metagenome]
MEDSSLGKACTPLGYPSNSSSKSQRKYTADFIANGSQDGSRLPRGGQKDWDAIIASHVYRV